MITIYPEGNLDICIKFQGNPFNSYFSQTPQKVTLLVALGEMLGTTKIIRIHPRGTMNVCTKIHSNHPNVKIFSLNQKS